MQENAQSIFNGMGNQLSNTNASEASAIGQGTNSLNSATGGDSVSSTPSGSGASFPGCTPGVSESVCTEQLNNWHANKAGSAQTAELPRASAVNGPQINGPQKLADCGYGGSWSGSSQCTDYLNKYYNKGFGQLPK